MTIDKMCFFDGSNIMAKIRKISMTIRQLIVEIWCKIQSKWWTIDLCDIFSLSKKLF